MSLQVRRRPTANRDVDEIAFFLSGFDPDNGFQFLDAVERTLQRVAAMPGLGRPFPIDGIPGLRRVSVAGFKKYYILYDSDEHAIDVLKVIHGSRDIRAILRGQA